MGKFLSGLFIIGLVLLILSSFIFAEYSHIFVQFSLCALLSIGILLIIYLVHDRYKDYKKEKDTDYSDY